MKNPFPILLVRPGHRYGVNVRLKDNVLTPAGLSCRFRYYPLEVLSLYQTQGLRGHSSCNFLTQAFLNTLLLNYIKHWSVYP